MAPANATAIQASVRMGDYPPPGQRRTPPRESYPVLMAPFVVPNAAPARCDGPLGGLAPDAGGGFTFASPARTIPHKEEPASATHAGR